MATVDLAFSEVGDGPPVLLLHAFPLDRRMFGDIGPLLADRVRCITPDLRGFGDSPLGDDAPSLDRMADDVAALLGRLGIERCVVGGISMGGYVAMSLLRRQPGSLSGVLLLDTKASADGDQARANRLRIAEAVGREGPAALAPMMDSLLGTSTRAARPDVVERVRGWMEDCHPQAVAWAQHAMAARPDSFAVLRTSRPPAAVIVGEEDTVATHEDALAMAAALGPHTVVHVIPASGHLTVIEQPSATAGAMIDALRHIAGQ